MIMRIVHFNILSNGPEVEEYPVRKFSMNYVGIDVIIIVDELISIGHYIPAYNRELADSQ